MVGVVDYGMGNLLSVYNGLRMVGAPVQICSEPEQLAGVDRLVLPGVGAFRDCMKNLDSKGFRSALDEAVSRRGTPILGICLGMQAMAARSFEGGELPGLSWFDADVVRLQPVDTTLRVPQVGWNQVTWRAGHPMLSGIPNGWDFYFVHSYYMLCNDPKYVEGTCDYGAPVTAAVYRDNIFGTQFHPEKSQDHGLKLLANFVVWKP